MTDSDRDAHAIALSAARTSASSELVFAAMEATQTAMVVSDPRLPDNPIVFANRAFRDLSGYTHEELIGRNCRFLQGPGTDPADVARIREAVAAGREITCDLLNYRRDGTGFVNELHISPIFDDAGELRYFSAARPTSRATATTPGDCRPARSATVPFLTPWTRASAPSR